MTSTTESTVFSTEKKPLNELDFGSDNDGHSSDNDPSRNDDHSSGEVSRSSDNSGSDNTPMPPRKKFMDEDEESDDDEIILTKKVIDKSGKSDKSDKSNILPIIGDRPITDYIFADVGDYSFKSWEQCFPDKKVTLRSLVFNPAWDEFFDMVEKKPYYKGMERILSDYLSKSKETIVPHAELVFNAFNILSPNKIKVVIVGQDPYPGMNKINGKLIPQAMGFSFSVPLNYPKPPSLENIYKNLLEFNHVVKMPTSGCLSSWILQGCFMINAAFTTFYTKKEAHKNTWKNFTDDLLEYINNKCKNVVFVVWGKSAHVLCKNIDPYKHHIITTSHPSPLGFDKTFSGTTYGKFKNPRDRKDVTYPSFKSIDHFGRINNYLKTINSNPILWDLVNI